MKLEVFILRGQTRDGGEARRNEESEKSYNTTLPHSESTKLSTPILSFSTLPRASSAASLTGGQLLF